MKLTKAQRWLLAQIKLEGPFGYYTGNLTCWWRLGFFGRRNLRLLLSLHDSGLIFINSEFFATLTPAGRAALNPKEA
jgi:hypothetical protein